MKKVLWKKFSYCPKCGIMLKHNIILGKHEGVMKKSLDEKSVWVEKPRLKTLLLVLMWNCLHTIREFRSSL